MPTTTNYGWTTPADTDLVKDGAAAIRTLGSSIDSTLKTQIDAQIPDSLLTTKGDLIAATGASTPARLGVGTNGQALIADSTTATGLKWDTPAAGGMTLISTTSLSGATTTLSSIPATYNNLRVVIKQFSQVDNGNNFHLRLNSDATANRHDFLYTNATNINAGGAGTYGYTYIRLVESTSSTAANGLCIIDIDDYTNTTTWKTAKFHCLGNNSATTTQSRIAYGIGFYNQTSAISSLQFFFDGTNADGGTILLYGVK